MKTKEEIDKTYLQVCKDCGSKEIASEYCGFIKGYTQCQEDQSDKKYTEEDMQEYAEFCIMCYEGRLPCLIAKDWFEKFKNKQD